MLTGGSKLVPFTVVVDWTAGVKKYWAANNTGG